MTWVWGQCSQTRSAAPRHSTPQFKEAFELLLDEAGQRRRGEAFFDGLVEGVEVVANELVERRVLDDAALIAVAALGERAGPLLSAAPGFRRKTHSRHLQFMAPSMSSERTNSSARSMGSDLRIAWNACQRGGQLGEVVSIALQAHS
jgi:hypothetical protein